MVERGRAGVMHAPRLLAHGDDAAARGWRGGEVDVRQLGESVAHLVVDGALRLISPPSMWAMGMRSASATEAGASIS